MIDIVIILLKTVYAYNFVYNYVYIHAYSYNLFMLIKAVLLKL